MATSSSSTLLSYFTELEIGYSDGCTRQWPSNDSVVWNTNARGDTTHFVKLSADHEKVLHWRKVIGGAIAADISMPDPQRHLLKELPEGYALFVKVTGSVYLPKRSDNCLFGKLIHSASKPVRLLIICKSTRLPYRAGIQITKRVPSPCPLALPWWSRSLQMWLPWQGITQTSYCSCERGLYIDQGLYCIVSSITSLRFHCCIQQETPFTNGSVTTDFRARRDCLGHATCSDSSRRRHSRRYRYLAWHRCLVWDGELQDPTPSRHCCGNILYDSNPPMVIHSL